MSWTHLADTQPVARRPHRCLLCDGVIPFGERHVKRAGIGDDGPESFRMHSTCEAKTHGWAEWEWESHDPSEFRSEILGDSDGE